MSITATLAALTPPSGSDFPGTPAGLLAFIAQYMRINGLDDFNGVNLGSASPAPENQDKPWFKVEEDGTPIGWFTWNGAAWTGLPLILPAGATTERPLTTDTGAKWFDTTINVELVFDRGKWRTVAGSPGDVKFVATDTLATALERNPGWIEYSTAAGRVLGAAGTGTGLTARAYGATVGAEAHLLTLDQIPTHAHGIGNTPQYAGLNNRQSGGSQPGIGSAPPATIAATDAIGGGLAHNNMQPTLFLWCLIKE
jgi:hypothetical protein